MADTGSDEDYDSFEDILVDLDSIEPITLPIDKEFHIFISYRGVNPDRKTAFQIDKRLKSRGYKCCLHEREFLPGECIVDNIVKHIERSVKIVFLLSENSKASEWCQFELNVAQTIHIQNKGYKPIILKLDECEVPDMMKRYTYLSASSMPDKWIGKVAKAINNTTDHLIQSRRNITFVAVPCIDYNRDKNHSVSICRYPHVCAKYIISDETCDKSCKKNHNLVTNQSRDILVDLGFETDGHIEALLQTYSQKCKEKLAGLPNNIVTGPCCYYNYKGCLLGDFHCPFTHICKDWFLGKCERKKCEWSHDILNDHTKRLLDIFEVDTTKSPDEILYDYRVKYPHKKFILMPTKNVSTVDFVKENWKSVATALFSAVVVTAFVVQKIPK